jgi:hypothetical protein
MLKALARHLLLLAVIFGLAGQGMARASTPCHEMAQATTMTDMPDCTGMRDAPKGKAPCKDMSLGCFAMAGCSAVVAIDAQPIIARAAATLVSASWPATPVLTGRDTAPEPDPPSFLD